MGPSETERQRLGNPTRVDISYKVLDGTPVRRIPFRAGVMGNLSGHTEGLPPLYEREFDYIDLKTFDKVMKRINPTLKLDVQDTLSEEPDKKLHVELSFPEFSAFHPSQLIRQIPRLWKLYETREKLLHAKRMMADPAVAEIATDAVKELKK